MGFERTSKQLTVVTDRNDIIAELFGSSDQNIVVFTASAGDTLVYFAGDFSAESAREAMEKSIGADEFEVEKNETTEKVFCFSTEKSDTVVAFSIKSQLHIS